MEYTDKILKCVEQTCETPNREFTVTSGEQSFFAGKGFPLPRRCPQCRINRKNRENSPFKPFADKVAKGEIVLDNPSADQRQYRGNKRNKNRRHGREDMNDFEGSPDSGL